MSNYHCDWFELTEPLAHSPFTEFMHHQLHAMGIAAKHSRGMNGYRERIEWGGAITEQFSSHDERMGRHWTFPGGAFEKLRTGDWDDNNWRYWVRKWAQLGKGNVTRIDLATDWTEQDARDIANEIRWGMNEGVIRKRSWKEWHNDALGYTFYLGSRQSDVMLRCYDKGAELDLEPFRLARTEFEVKKAKGRNVGDGLRALMRYGNNEETTIGDWLCSVMVGLFVEFIPANTLERLGVGKWGVHPITLGSWLPKQQNKDAWWWNVVIPSLARRLRLDNGSIDNEFWEALQDEVQKRLNWKGPENE